MSIACLIPEVTPAPVMADYRYELRRGEEVIATGYFSRDLLLEVGERIALAGRRGIVRTIEPVLGRHELRMVVQLQREYHRCDADPGTSRWWQRLPESQARHGHRHVLRTVSL